VGREQELALLELTFNTCTEEPCAQAALVVAAAGVGKSRLRHEFLRRLERRASPPLVLLARGVPPLGGGSSYGLLGQALRELCGVHESQPLEQRWERLAQRLARHLPPAQAPATVELLGELCGLPPRAERADPRQHGAQMGRALQGFLAAECAQGPVLLVLEDLHWGDMLTVRLVEELLRALAHCPFMVLALARPEVKERFPGLWGSSLLEIRLRGLSRQASARLAREVLGAEAPEPILSRLVEQAAGNTLFLEELIRGVAEGRGEAPPETVLAMLQVRLSRLEPEARQVLLGASFFGRAFWPGGVRALLGPQPAAEALEQWLSRLAQQEIIEPQPGSRFASEPEYRFRHALVREAAYALVPESHRPEGHRLAGAWLEQAGEVDLLVLAEHYRLGQQREQAALLYARAAEQLFERYELQGALRCLETGLACGPELALRSRLRALQASVAFWLEDPRKALDIGGEVLADLPAGSTPWCRLMTGLIMISAYSPQVERAEELCRLLHRATPGPEAVTSYVDALCMAQISYVCRGERSKAEACRERMDEVLGALASRDTNAEGWRGFANSYFTLLLTHRPWEALTWARRGLKAHLDAGLEHNTTATRSLEGLALAALGDFTGAVQASRESLEIARRTGQLFPTSHAQVHLALVLSGTREPAHWEDARSLAEEWLKGERTNLVHLGLAFTALARVALQRGALLEAEAHGRKACEVLRAYPALQPLASPPLSRALLAQGRAAEAREVATLGTQVLERLGGASAFAMGPYLALAQACAAQGDTQAAEAARQQALQSLQALAEDVPEGPARQQLLREAPILG
jgi:tetratricopeptide (TPR) repeat protein